MAHGLPSMAFGTLMMVLLHRRLKKRPVCYFLICMGICAVVEYVTSWGLEQLFHGKRLDYTGYFLNVNGRICAMSLLLFCVDWHGRLLYSGSAVS